MPFMLFMKKLFNRHPMINRTFPNLITFQTLLFRVYLQRFVNNLLAYPKRKESFKAIFAVILRVFDLQCHVQTPLKVASIIFGLVFTKFRELKNLHHENKNLMSSDWSSGKVY